MSERKKRTDSTPDGGSLSDQPSWFKSVESKIPSVRLFPHCKLGDGFAQYAIGSDTGCILVWTIDRETYVDEAALNLEKAKECLVNDEPCSEHEMVLILNPPRRIDASIYEKRNIRCLTERQLVQFALEFFSETREQIRLGKLAYHQRRYKIAFSLLTSVNVDNDADAQFIIGQMYAKGKGVAKDRKAAEQWYWKATQQGHAGAAREAEKALNREMADLERREQALIDEVREFTRKLLEDDD